MAADGAPADKAPRYRPRHLRGGGRTCSGNPVRERGTKSEGAGAYTAFMFASFGLLVCTDPLKLFQHAAPRSRAPYASGTPESPT